MEPFIVHLNARLIRRFDSKVERHGRGECHIWKGGYNSRTGYPYLDIRSRRAHAAKIAYAIARYPRDDYVNLADLPVLGMACRNRRCVKFEHMTPGVYTRQNVIEG